MTQYRGPYDVENRLRVNVETSTPGTAATSLGKAEDAVHASGDVGVLEIDVRSDTPASTAGSSGDYAAATQDAFGGKWVALEWSGTPVSFAGITTNFRLLTALGTTNSNLVKATAGFIYHITGRNVRASSVFLKLYSKVTAPTIGTDVPFATIEIPASTAFDFAYEKGMFFAAGIGFGLTTAGPDADTGAITAADITALNIFYT